MTVGLLVAPPASGKTQTCIERLQAALRQHPPGYVRVVLPDRTQVRFFRQRLAEAGGALGAQTGTFEGLYADILARAESDLPRAPGALRQRVMHAAVEQLHAGGELTHYAALRRMPGFIQLLLERISELKRALVLPDDLLRTARERGEPGLAELAKAYAAYQTRLDELGWTDQEGLAMRAIAALEVGPHLMQDLALLVVDGFDSFNPAQLRALKLLSERLRRMLITLPGTPQGERSAQRRFANTREALKVQLPLEIESLPEEPRLPPTIRYLERYLFVAGADTAQARGDLRMLEVRSPEHEAREGLRWLKERHLRHGTRLERCAVIVPHMSVYRPLLRSAGNEFGIPLRFSSGEPLTGTPLIAALMDLLHLPLRNYPLRPLLDVMRSPFFDLAVAGLQKGDASVFEAISRHCMVVEGIEQWDEAFRRLEAKGDRKQLRDVTDEEPLDEDGSLTHLPQGSEVQAPRATLHTLAALLTPAAGAQTVEGWVSWLEDLLSDLRTFELERSTEEIAILMELRQVLRAMVLSEAVSGGQMVDYARFLEGLQGALGAAAYRLPEEASRPAVHILTIEEARGLRFEAVALLGLAEGSFPAAERSDPLLGEVVRKQLGMEARQGREQGGLFYQVLTRADGCLLLTRPRLAEDGEFWEPSPYWTAVEALVGKIAVDIRPDDARPLEDAASPGELLFWAVRRAIKAGYGLPKNYGTRLGPRWKYLRHAREVLTARRAADPAGPFEGYPVEVAAALVAHYSPSHEWSASQLESYTQCPFKFFTEKALNLKPVEVPKPGFDIAQAGSIAHAILEEAYKGAADPADPELVIEALAPAAQKVFRDAPVNYGFRPSVLWEVQQAEILASMEKNIREFAKLEAGWTPIEFECRYGLNGKPMLEISIAGERMLLHGVIDRIDRNDEGKLRVMDYKSGGSMSKEDLVEGRHLQLPLYALAASHALGLGEVVEGFYWLLSGRKPSSLKLSSFKYEGLEGVEAAIKAFRSHAERVIKGTRAGEFPPIPPENGCPSYCPAAAWCWRFERSAW